MKAYNFETLLNYVFKRLSFSSRVRVMGHWDWYADDIPPGSRMRVTFYLERMAKKDIRQIDDLNGTELLEGITLETAAAPISVYSETLEREMRNGEWSQRKYEVLRNDFADVRWYLRRDQVITLLDYLLCGLDLPRLCAVVAFNCKPKGGGVRRFGDLELLFVFPVVQKKLIREVKKLERKILLADVHLNVHTMDLETYEKFLAGELDYFDENLKNTGITLYDAFHRKRLKAAFMKK